MSRHRGAPQVAAPAKDIGLLDLQDDCLFIVMALLARSEAAMPRCALAVTARRLQRIALSTRRSLSLTAADPVRCALALSTCLKTLRVVDESLRAHRWYERPRLGSVPALLPAAPSLERLTLRGNAHRRIGVGRTLAVAFGLPACGSLPRPLKLPPSTRLTVLTLEACFETGDDMTRLGSVVAALPALTSILLRNNAISWRAAASLARALAANSRLTYLDVSHNPLDASGVETLVHELACLPNLQHVDLADTLTAPGWLTKQVPATPPVHELTALTSLSLAHNPITPRQFADLGVSLQRLTRLRTLSLAHTGMQPDLLQRGGVHAVRALAPALAAMPSLSDIDLSDNGINTDDLEVLLPSLIPLAALRSLDLSSSSLSASAVPVLAAYLPRMHALLRLDLADNALGTRGSHDLLALLADAMQRAESSLQYLNLVNNGIMPRGAEYCVSVHGPDLGAMTVDLFGAAAPAFNKAGDAPRALRLHAACAVGMHCSAECRQCVKRAAARAARRSKPSTCMVK